MKGLFGPAGVCTFIGLLLAPLVWAASLPDLIEQVRPGIVAVGTAYPPRQPNVKGDRVVYLATGFVVGDGLHIITNAHVIDIELDVDNNQTLAVFSGTGVEVTAHPALEVRRDKEHDLALLYVDCQGLTPIEWAVGEPTVGTLVVAANPRASA